MGTPSLLFPILPTITPSKNTSTRKHSMSSLINKAKEALSGHKEHNTNTTTTNSSTHHHENVPANTPHNTTGNLHSTPDTAAAPTGDAHNLVGGSLNPMGTYT